MADDRTVHTVNWTPIVVGGLVIAGGVVVWKILQDVFGESEEQRQMAREILVEWKREWDIVEEYFNIIYANNRTPTDQEVATLSAMVEEMKGKEEAIKNLSSSVFEELKDLMAGIAADLWLVSKSAAVVVLTYLGAGWLTPKILKEWKNRRGPPPSFGCPICGELYGTSTQLKNHVLSRHAPSNTYAQQAQAQFQTAHTWVRDAVCVENFYGNIYTNWATWSLPNLSLLHWGIIYAIVLGIGSLGTLSGVSVLLIAL